MTRFPPVAAEEVDQAGNVVATYTTTQNGSDNMKWPSLDVKVPGVSTSYLKSFMYAFLPAGYPNSVTHDYLEYQIYDSLQAFSSSIASLLASRAVLEGVGVGDASASPTAALLLSVLQSSMGRIATILFAHRLGSALEPECKMYRLSADVFNDAAMILDCLSPAFPKTTRVVVYSFSSVLRALCGVAAGSSKASLSAHFATQGNLAELNAKDSSQETIISLMGMWAGSFVVSRISSQFATWTAMIFLLAIHLGTNYLAVKAVTMRTLNRQRANLIISHYYSQSDSSAAKVLTPEQVSIQEKVFERDGVLRWQGGKPLGYCVLGVDLQTILKARLRDHKRAGIKYHTGRDCSDYLSVLLDLYRWQDYIIHYAHHEKTFYVVLKSNSTVRTQLIAWTLALKAAKRIDESEEPETTCIAHWRDVRDLLSTLERYCPQHVDAFFAKLEEAGWDLKTGAMETRSGTRLMVGQTMGSGGGNDEKLEKPENEPPEKLELRKNK